MSIAIEITSVKRGAPKYTVGQRVKITVGKGRSKGETNEIEMEVIAVVPKSRRHPEHRYSLKGRLGGLLIRKESTISPTILPYRGHAGQK